VTVKEVLEIIQDVSPDALHRGHAGMPERALRVLRHQEIMVLAEKGCCRSSRSLRWPTWSNGRRPKRLPPRRSRYNGVARAVYF